MADNRKYYYLKGSFHSRLPPIFKIFITNRYILPLPTGRPGAFRGAGLGGNFFMVLFHCFEDRGLAVSLNQRIF